MKNLNADWNLSLSKLILVADIKIKAKSIASMVSQLLLSLSMEGVSAGAVEYNFKLALSLTNS